MEIKKKLEKAIISKEFIKLVFVYPGFDKFIIKRGYVIKCHPNSFDFNEIFDGNVSYSYEFIKEIKHGADK